MLGDFRLDVRMLWKSFPTQGSHNRLYNKIEEKIYSLSRKKREEVQAFVENQLQKGYIQLLKLP